MIKAYTKTGVYRGKDNNGIVEFLGIDYAKPIERWKAPQPLDYSDREIDALEWGPSCLQPWDAVEIASQWKQSESCLNLNVWTKNMKTKGKPVMVFIHGGGARNGGSYDPLYDGEYFVRDLPNGEDVVFVTFNYRLGPWGSLNLEVLEGYTDEYKDAMNLNVLDQRLALKWIFENVQAFGGDPDNITLFGQSAGGGATSTHMLLPESRKYFNKAIIESGTFFNRLASVRTSRKMAKELFAEMGVKSINELLAIPGETIRDEYIDVFYKHGEGASQRVQDGYIIPYGCMSEIVNGNCKDISVMIGYTNGEKDSDAMDWNNVPDSVHDPDIIWDKLENIQRNVRGTDTSICPDESLPIVNSYLYGYDDQVRRMVDLKNDIFFRMGATWISEEQSKWNENVYMYQWNYAPEIKDVIASAGDAAEVSPYGRALHSMELAFVFHTLEKGYPEMIGVPTETAWKVAKTAHMAWYSFAKNGNPENEYISEWKPYNTDTRVTMVIDEECKQISDMRKEDRKLLNGFKKYC